MRDTLINFINYRWKAWSNKLQMIGFLSFLFFECDAVDDDDDADVIWYEHFFSFISILFCFS